MTARHASAIEATGSCDFAGEAHAFVLTTGGDGRFSMRLEGPLASRFGFDGARGWTVGWSHKLDVVEGTDLATIRLAHWVWAGRTPRDTRAWSVVPRGAAKGAAKFAIRGGPSAPPGASALEATLLVDVATGRSRRLSYRTAKGECSHEYLEFDRVAGVPLPSRWRETDAGVVTRYAVDRFRVVSEPDFRAPPEPPGHASFDEGDAETTSELDAAGRPLVEASVDGGESGWFVLDTGASVTVLDAGLAAARGYPTFGATKVVGAGGAVASRFCRARDLRVGPLVVRDVACLCIELSALSEAVGRSVQGICGYDLLSRCVARIDPVGGRVRLRRAEPPRTGCRIEMRGNVPTVRARFAPGIEDDFVIDTGFPGAVLFHHPAVRRLRLDSRDGGRAADELGGTARLAFARIDWMELAGERIEDVPAILALAGTGALADPTTAGRVGSAMFRDREAILDYAGRNFALVPRGGAT